MLCREEVSTTGLRQVTLAEPGVGRGGARPVCYREPEARPWKSGLLSYCNRKSKYNTSGDIENDSVSNIYQEDSIKKKNNQLP